MTIVVLQLQRQLQPVIENKIFKENSLGNVCKQTQMNLKTEFTFD